MQPFDHFPVERDHAFLRIVRPGEGSDDLLRLGERRSGRRKRGVRRLDLRRMDQRLAVKPHCGALGAFACKRIEIAKIIADAVEHVEAAGARGQHHLHQPWHEIAAVRRRQNAGFLDQVIRSGNETIEPCRLVAAEFGQCADIEHRFRGLDHDPEAKLFRRIGLVQRVVDIKNIARRVHLGQQDRVGLAGANGKKIFGAPFTCQRIDADDAFRPARSARREISA